jgi:hypothetical protein
MHTSDKSSGRDTSSGRTRYGHHDREPTYGSPQLGEAEKPPAPSASITDEEFAAANASCIAEQSAP